VRKILITIDGSESSKAALLEGKKLAELMKSEVLLLYVEKHNKVEGPFVDVSVLVDVHEDLEEIGKQVINDGLEVFKNYSGSVKAKTEFGDPGEVIIEIAEKEKVNLIIMGSRGLSRINRFYLGSVSNKVLNDAHISVLIIK